MAVRWGMQPESLSAIARNPERAQRYDDMLHGLPNLNRVARELQRRAKQVESALIRIGTGKRGEEAPESEPVRLTPGYRYHGYLVPGALVAAACDVGEMAEEGSRGIVFEVQNDGVQEVYGVIFESGLWDWFPPDYVDRYLATIGLSAPDLESYRYAGESALQEDFAAGRFEFWPVLS